MSDSILLMNRSEFCQQPMDTNNHSFLRELWYYALPGEQLKPGKTLVGKKYIINFTKNVGSMPPLNFTLTKKDTRN